MEALPSIAPLYPKMVCNCEMAIMPPIPQEKPAMTLCGTFAAKRPSRRKAEDHHEDGCEDGDFSSAAHALGPHGSGDERNGYRGRAPDQHRIPAEKRRDWSGQYGGETTPAWAEAP